MHLSPMLQTCFSGCIKNPYAHWKQVGVRKKDLHIDGFVDLKIIGGHVVDLRCLGSNQSYCDFKLLIL